MACCPKSLSTLAAQADLAEKAIPALTKMWGFPCDVFFPISNASIYQTKDNTYVYPGSYSFTGLLLITGVGYARMESDETLDVYNIAETIPVEMWVVPAQVDIPNYSAVRVKLLNSNVLTYRIQEVRAWYEADAWYLKKFRLIPIEDFATVSGGGSGVPITRNGSTAIPIGESSVSVPFSLPFYSIPTVVVAVATAAGEDLIYANVRAGSISTAGFIVDLSVAAPTGNYTLQWEAVGY